MSRLQSCPPLGAQNRLSELGSSPGTAGLPSAIWEAPGARAAGGLGASISFCPFIGDGRLRKRLVSAGLGESSRPRPGQEVTVKLLGVLEDQCLVEKDPQLRFILGQGGAIQVRLAGWGGECFMPSPREGTFQAAANPLPSSPTRSEPLPGTFVFPTRTAGRDPPGRPL